MGLARGTPWRAFRVQWEFQLTDIPNGTRLVQRARFHPVGLFGRVMLYLLRRRQIPKENVKSLARVKAILEESEARR